MDVLAVIGAVLLGGVLLFFIFWGLSTLYILIPTIAGLIVGIWLWRNDHDNIGMLVILAGFVGQPFWMEKVREDIHRLGK